ncbi:SpoIIE family protein phosphatase [Nocardioides panaciterrulae]|uniref:Anti-sigma regulatory factor (Ser/Thr protein kinase) n=1 Tax=Nocardioides panaciterrulae TaxID=661492 RepID=A0A7Y9E7W9_9ACTN|nr:SpoIIE family protein phosphatase [Nocardioides panaciterrulae]NYD42738.1 anti-sigma regulatory factor (Ser/Thr protein kinase) [Nocardioides panaciterrulae]
MTSTARATAPAESRDALLLAAQLELLSGVVSGHQLGPALDALLRVVERVSTGGLLASVLLLSEDGRQLRHGAAPSLPDHYNEAIDGLRIGPSVGSCGTAAWRRRQVIVENIEADPLWADFRDLAVGAGLRACWSTPIFGGGGRLLGTFAMYYPAPSRPKAGDLALIDVLVRTVGMAIDRSRWDEERERELAEERALGTAFQRSLLPQIPNRIGAVELAARYRTGDPGVHVGGDWFDAIEVEDGLVLVVGDVQGHDIQAAAMMGQLRTVVRATASDGHPPADVLARTAHYLERLGSDLLATVLVVHLDTHARLATIACAGHLPPVVLGIEEDGTTLCPIEVEPGPPLGVGEVWEERSTHLPADAYLLLYTDGLVETRNWDIDEGIHRLETLIATVPPQAGPGRLLDQALELLPIGSRGDDVAVLAARVPPVPGGSARRVVRKLPAQPMSVPLVRSWAEGWLAAQVAVEHRDDVLLVVSELMTNAVRQADGAVRTTLQAEDRGVRVEVFDRGHRMPVLSDTDLDATGGRGLLMIEAVCAEWGVVEELEGKTVWARLAW